VDTPFNYFVTAQNNLLWLQQNAIIRPRADCAEKFHNFL
jgi:hypothetical protein